MHALDPVGDLLVREPVAAPRGDEYAFGEDGRGPRRDAPAVPPRQRAPGEHLLERLPVQLALTRPQTAPRRLVDLPGHPGGEPAHGRAAQPVHSGEAHRHPQAHEVEIRGEDGVPVGAARRGPGQRGPHLGEEPQRERMPGVAAA